jgi:hypothetical protein
MLSRWDLVSMQTVESLTRSAISTGNALISAAQRRGQSTETAGYVTLTLLEFVTP